MLSGPRLKWILLVVIGVPIAIYVFSAVNYVQRCSPARASCLEHRNAGCNIDGDYTIRLGSVMAEATCDMHTEGGGWTLVANYLHRGIGTGRVGAKVIETGHFPLVNQTLLGGDERNTPAWGHVNNQTLAAMAFKEVRFRCQSSSHERLVDFALSGERCLNYFRTGHGACDNSPEAKQEIMTTSRGLLGHNGRLPLIADKGWADQGDMALVNYPFFFDFRHHWSVGAADNRFECDDYESGGKTNTWHQVWVR